MMSSQVVPQGYKQTKVGVIPEDWEVVKINDVTDYVDYRGKTPKKVENGILLVTARNIKQGYLDYEISKEYIAKDDYKSVMSRGIPKIGDVLLTTEAPLGNIAQIDNENIALAQRVIKFRARNDLDNTYLKYHFLSKKFQVYLLRLAIGTTVLGIQGKQLHKMLIPFPPLKEQQKIADILTTWDDAITKQEKLIKAKERLKKGLMQKLLSGKVRFEGFDGEWEEVLLGEVFDFIKTYSNSRSHLSNIGDIQYIHYGDIHTKYKYHLDFDKNTLPMILKNKIKGTIAYVKNGDLIIADASEDYADIGKSAEVVNLKNKKVISGLHTFLLRDNANNFAEGYKGLLLYNQSVSKEIKKIATGISVLGISKTNLGKLLISLPPIKEQQKITQVLTLADKEIDLLKNELETLKEQKKGLMQRLLSGKVRVSV